MDLSLIRELLKIVAESDVAEVEIEEDDFKLVVRRHSANVSIQASPGFQIPAASPIPYYTPPYQSTAPAPPPAIPSAVPEAPSPQSNQNAASGPESSEQPEPKSGHVIKAPIVGTFYRASSPDADPYVKVGDQVQPGDVLCIIEAMKLMNEIESEVSGTIKEILIENSEPVEYDQPLFVIEKS